MSIKPLPGHVVAQIKSSVVITSVNNVVIGLIANSLDAQASRINVSVDYSRGNCSVEDNGSGIPPSEFKEGGGLGQLHYTSKYPAHPDIHGKHGLFLASVASLSLLSVTSHHRDFHSHNSMSIHNSTVLTRNAPCLPEQRLLTFAHGTRVTVRDLFGAMPVRVKHRALQAEKSSFIRDWDRVVLHVVALLIPWSGAVSVSIRDTASRQSLTFKVGSERRQWVNDSCRLLHHASFLDSPDVSDWVAVGASSPALSIKGYVCREPVATKRAQFISLGIVPVSNENRGNVLYDEVNKVFSDSSFGLVEDDSDAAVVLKRSKPDGFTQRELKIRKGVDRWPMFFLKMTSTATTAPQALDVDDVLDDRQPNLAIIVDLLKAMFYEFLKRNHCRPRKIALSTKARGQNERVSSPKPTRAASDTSPRKRPSTTNPHLASAGDAARDTSQNEAPDSLPESPFAFWSKVKSGKPMKSFKQSDPFRSRAQSISMTPTQESQNSPPVLTVPEASRISTPSGPSSRPSLFDVNGKLTRKPFDDVDPRELMNKSATRESRPESEADTDAIPVLMHTEEPNPASELPPHDGTVEWVNPLTSMVTVINARTGFAMAPKPLTLSRRVVHKSGGPSRVLEEGPPEKAKEVTPWVKDLVSNWNNPVFDTTEAPIPKLPDVVEMLGLEPRPAGHHCHHGQASFSVGTRHETTAMSLQGRLSRETLERAELIAQVDKKFIFAKVSFDHARGRADDELLQEPLEPSSVLILIDQHAADERCRVEGLLSTYFHPQTDSNGSKIWKVVTEALPRPVQFELSGQDKDLLVQLQPYFDYWGICYEVEACAPSMNCKTTSRSNKAKVSVTSLPPAIAERCRTDPRMLAELIRTEAWRLKDEDRLARAPNPRPVLPRDVAADPYDWVALFHNCPPGIVVMINSRSCRSAIMFNDPLTMDQCSDLLGRLVRCAFPFQCAHGRPSMVPLVDLGDGMVQLGNLGEDNPVEGRGGGFGQAFKKWQTGLAAPEQLPPLTKSHGV